MKIKFRLKWFISGDFNKFENLFIRSVVQFHIQSFRGLVQNELRENINYSIQYK